LKIIFKRNSAFHEVPFDIGTEFELEVDDSISKRANIVDRVQQMFYEVDFGDGTYSSDMPPEDIEVIFKFKELV
jgi:hypothetical protein